MRHGEGHGQDSRPKNCVEKIDNATDPACLADCASDIAFEMTGWTSGKIVSIEASKPAASHTFGLCGSSWCWIGHRPRLNAFLGGGEKNCDPGMVFTAAS